MTLLLRDPDAQPGEQTSAAPAEAPPDVRACPTCQAPLQDGQDWCLHCGQAQPGRLGRLPGMRAAGTVLALTTVLVGGAVAASYAALQDDPKRPAAPAPTQVAQAPAPVPAPAPVAPVEPSSATPAEPVTPEPAAPAAPPDTSADTADIPAPADTETDAGAIDPSTDTASSTTGKKDDAKAQTRTSTTPADTAPKAIKLEAGAAAAYDPYKRDTAAGDPAKALDADPGTSFPVTVAPGSQQIGAGLVVDLGKTRGIRELDVKTKTPGFRIEVYATDSDELPPDVLDTRWAHLKDVSAVGTGADGREVVTLGSGTTKYRHLLLWFTAPPTDGTTVRVSELKLLG